MQRSMIHLGLGFWLIAGAVAFGADLAAPIELKEGDRVVLVGSALIERDGESGYLETRLARRYPGRGIVFRNLGWTGDTVEGITRGKPVPPVDGFKQLVEHVVALKPTVIVLGYGANEAFGGAAGLPAFQAGLDRLWTELAKTGARFVVLTPTRQENLGPPLPDPTAHNADLARYGAALKAEAARRGGSCVDLFDSPLTSDPRDPGPWTTNGVHLTPAGYWKASGVIAPALSGPPAPAPVVALADGRATATGATVSGLAATPTGWTFQVRYDLLPEVPRPNGAGPAVLVTEPRRVRVAGLAPGRYGLRIDGTPVIQAEAAQWHGGVAIGSEPEVAQVEALRARINRKNLLYFHRWRPQNETYLFGFRKHEQGRNAAELAAFDPLIAAEEAEIVRLSRPSPHTYELVREPEGKVAR